MAFSLGQFQTATVSASVTTATLSGITNPSAGQLLMCGVALDLVGAPSPTVAATDNGDASNPWTQLKLDQSGTNPWSSTWYKVATATDASNLTSITWSWGTSATSASGGAVWMAEWDGWTGLGTPTLNLAPTTVTGSGVATASISSTAAAATNLQLAVAIGNFPSSSGGFTGTNQYTANNGTNQRALSCSNSSADRVLMGWVQCSDTPATKSTWTITWATSRAFALYGYTFYPVVQAPSTSVTVTAEAPTPQVTGTPGYGPVAVAAETPTVVTGTTATAGLASVTVTAEAPTPQLTQAPSASVTVSVPAPTPAIALTTSSVGAVTVTAPPAVGSSGVNANISAPFATVTASAQAATANTPVAILFETDPRPLIFYTVARVSS